MANMLHGSARTTPRIGVSFPKVKRKDQYPGPALRAEPHHGYEVAISHNHHRCTHGAFKAQKHSALARRGGGNRGVLAKNAAAAGRRDGVLA